MRNPFEHYFAGENLYVKTVTPVCEKHKLTYMEFTVLMFLANNPEYDTASEIVKYRHLTKSHVSISIRSLQERGLLSTEYRDGNRRIVHLRLLDSAALIISDGKAAQKEFEQILFAGFNNDERFSMDQFMERIDRNIELHAKNNK